jgi:hypothetical protein
LVTIAQAHRIACHFGADADAGSALLPDIGVPEASAPNAGPKSLRLAK